MSKRMGIFSLLLLCVNLLLGAALLLRLPPAQAGAASLHAPPGQSTAYPVSLFCWEEDWRLSERPRLFGALETLGVDTVYQAFSDEALYSDEARSYLEDLRRTGRSVYYLAGSREWGLDGSAVPLQNQIDQLLALNDVLGESACFAGILFDVEPYLSEQWKSDEQGTMEAFCSAIRSAYVYAHTKGLRMILCIPNWFDEKSPALLETLIAEGCDEVAVMNYTRSREISAIETELALAQKHQKPIVCIFEFQRPGVHSLTEDETYYTVGLSQAKVNFEALSRKYSYPGLGFSYHYYQPVRELLDRPTR